MPSIRSWASRISALVPSCRRREFDPSDHSRQPQSRSEKQKLPEVKNQIVVRSEDEKRNSDAKSVVDEVDEEIEALSPSASIIENLAVELFPIHQTTSEKEEDHEKIPEVLVYASTPQCNSRDSSPVREAIPPPVETEPVEPDSGFNSSTTGKESEASTETLQNSHMPPIEASAVNSVNRNGQLRNSTSSPPGGYQRQKSNSSDAERRRQRRLQMPLMYRMYESQSEDVRGTVRGPDDDSFRPEEASKRLRAALGGGLPAEADDKAIMQVLLSHTNFQRQKIVAAYEGMYNRKLSDDIEEEVGGFFLDATLALLQPAHVYSARILHNSLSIRSVNRSIAVEIALTSSSSQLKVIKDAYFNEYHVSLEKDLGLKVEGLFGKMLQLILLRKNDPSDDVDIELADSMIAEITKNEHGVEEIGRNLDLFARVFANQGLNQIRCFVDRFDAKMNSAHQSTETISEASKAKDFESILRKSVNIHSEVRQMMLMYSKIARNMQLYFAERIHEAISGTRPDHSAIIRILVTRSEIDLHDICDEYKKKYGRHVVLDLQQTCSGDFLRLLNLLVVPMEHNDDVFS
ncbi:unnamed protein product [Bursaphelenchus xylophilus]|uniref:(pine wood nematode) hypothetical protein n=1 Tax=Bursaphelenchus xylophilus TaxID=6326 RepID=A0A1I7RS21_BURXY|nr:unnamed protein product [Bursaphelenchus xylophilus]CAG9123309.1 unnamed protein product [Bursaphelenchus xylophilus]